MLVMSNSVAQDEFKIFGTIRVHDQSVEGATVRLMEDYKTVQRFELDASGLYAFYIPYNKTYTLLYEKKGLLTTKIAVNLVLPPDAKQCCYRPLNLSFHLYKPDSIHSAMLKNTFYTVEYKKEHKGFVYNVDIDYMLQQKIINDEIFTKTLASVRKGASERNDSLLHEQVYLTLITKGTDYYNNNQYAAARKFFLEANRLKPEQLYPTYKLEDIRTEIHKLDKQKPTTDNIDSILTQELAKLKNTRYAEKTYQAFTPLTDEQVDGILKEDLTKQINATIQNPRERSRTLALMEELFTTPIESVPAPAPAPKKIAQKQIAKELPEPQHIYEPDTYEEKIAQTAPAIQKQQIVQAVVDYDSYQDSLKQKYAEERTVEITSDKLKKTTRVIVNNGQTVEIYSMVEHNWGATYYFKEEYPNGATNIGYSSFMNNTQLYKMQEQESKTSSDSALQHNKE